MPRVRLVTVRAWLGAAAWSSCLLTCGACGDDEAEPGDGQIVGSLGWPAGGRGAGQDAGPADAACSTAPEPGAGCTATFQRAYGGPGDEKGAPLLATTDGGYLLVGRTGASTEGPTDLLAVKTDACGALQWQRTFGGAGNEEGLGAAAAADGGFLLLGQSDTWPGSYVVRVDAAGELVWSAAYGGEGHDASRAALALPDGGFVVVGETYSYGPAVPQKHNLLAFRIDAQGEVLWSRAYGGATKGEAGFALTGVHGPSGLEGVLVVGGTESWGLGNDDIWLARLDLQGAHLWSVAYGGKYDDEARAVVQLADGGFLVTGFVRSLGAIGTDVFLLRTDAAGNLLWFRHYGGGGDDEGHGLLALADGFVVSGHTSSFGHGSADALLLRTDLQGQLQWLRTYGGKHGDQALGLVAAADGGVALGGHTYTFTNGHRDLYLVKETAAGSTECHSRLVDLALVTQASPAPVRTDFAPAPVTGGDRLPALTVTGKPGVAARDVTACGCP